ncbi:MAG TPA: DUF2905 domain-containing protein [Candidatus Omnitrophica bacterium]|nr:DUF2905 domain-containing protein [Candidatus Omnitrophota bacterium]
MPPSAPVNSLNLFAKIIIATGLLLIVVGGIIFLIGKIPWIGKLPGDIYISKKNFTFYFPIITCILISLFLSLILYLFFRR